MNLKNQGTCAEITSENPIEAKALLTASMASYSPRSAGHTQTEDRLLILNESEADEFSAGVLRDVRLSKQDKWSICKLIACWLSGEITDEASAAPYRESLEAIRKLTCEVPIMNSDVETGFERRPELEQYRCELNKLILAIREQASTALALAQKEEA